MVLKFRPVGFTSHGIAQLVSHELSISSLQNAPVTSWPSQRQVLVPSWQQLPGLASQTIPESWRRPLVRDDNITTTILVQSFSFERMHYSYIKYETNQTMIPLKFLLKLIVHIFLDTFLCFCLLSHFSSFKM